jgi:hypothetical protein
MGDAALRRKEIYTYEAPWVSVERMLASSRADTSAPGAPAFGQASHNSTKPQA